MFVQPGSLAEYKHRGVPYAIWFDISKRLWCVDTRKAGPKGSIRCTPSAAESVLLGKRIIEDIFQSQKSTTHMLAPKPAFPMLPASPSRARPREQKIEHWQGRASKRSLPDPRLRPARFETLRQAVKTLPSPFTVTDLSDRLSVVQNRASVVVAQLQQLGYVHFYESRARGDKQRFGYDRYFVLTPEGQEWVSEPNPVTNRSILIGCATLVTVALVLAFASRAVIPCASWKFPAFNELPKDVVARTIELQHDLSKPIGYQTIEVWHGHTYRFNVRMHPANAIVNAIHRGADVEICASS